MGIGIRDFFQAMSSDNPNDNTMSGLNDKDWDGMSDDNRIELLEESPKRLKEIIGKFYRRVSSMRAKKQEDEKITDELEKKYGPLTSDNPIRRVAQRMEEKERNQKQQHGREVEGR